MLTITSSAHEQIKHLKKLQTKKVRQQSGEFVIENIITIVDAQKAGYTPLKLYITTDCLQKNKAVLKAIIAQVPYIIISPSVNKYVSSLSTPAGIVGVYQQIIDSADLQSNLIYFNNISDPGNLGTLLRSAVAFGFNNVVVDEHCADLYNPKTLSASKEAIFKLKISFDSKRQLFKTIKNNLPIYATSLQGKNLQPLLSAKKFCLVLGNEANGVSVDIINQAKAIVKIPLDKKMESLNVAIAGSIIFYILRNAK